MRVKQIMSKDFITLKPETTYEEAVSLFCRNNLNGAIVVDEKESLVGYLSEKDLFRVLYPYYKSFYEHPENYVNGEKREEKAQEIKYHKISEFMSKSLLTVNPDTPIMNAGALMLANRVHQFPVVENGKVVGMISREMIYKTVFKNSFKNIEKC
jgi:CBS domain-containing protein